MPSSATPPVQPGAEPSAARAQPFLRFYFSESLHAKTLAVLAKVEQAEDPTRHRAALAGMVVELTNSGMDYYFLRALKRAKAGFVIEQSAHMGMAGATRILSSVIHNIISLMDKAQLLVVCSYIRELMA